MAEFRHVVTVTVPDELFPTAQHVAEILRLFIKSGQKQMGTSFLKHLDRQGKSGKLMLLAQVAATFPIAVTAQADGPIAATAQADGLSIYAGYDGEGAGHRDGDYLAYLSQDHNKNARGVSIEEAVAKLRGRYPEAKDLQVIS